MDLSGLGASNSPGSQQEQGSDDYSTGNQCEQCQEDELSVPADGYCADCGHYLCGSCIKLHRKFLIMKDHTMLTGKDMPHQKPQVSAAEKCSKHPGKPVELYCQSDDTLGCVLCFTVGHKSCQNVQRISDMSKDVESSKELNDIQTAAQQHETTVEVYRKLIAECHDFNNTCYDKSLDDFHFFREEIESLLDRLGEAMETAAGALKETNKKNLDSVSKRVTSLDKEMVAIMTDIGLKRKLKENGHLFIALKKNMKSIKDKVQTLQQLKNDIQIQRYVFNEHSQIKQGLEQMFNTGIKKMATGDITCTGKINIKSPGDKQDCDIDGMVCISSTRMAITDYDNQCLKLIDVAQSIVIVKPLTSRPYDVTVIPRSRVVVILPDLHQLHLFKTDAGLEPCGHIAVDGRCLSVESTWDRLVVGYNNPSKVQIMDLDGQVLKSFTTDPLGNPLFGLPRFLILSQDHTSIFISDWENNTVTRMSTEGMIEWVYRDKDLKSPQGVTSGPDGCLYICSQDNHSLHVVSASGVRQKIVQEDQLRCPQAICYSKDQNVLYVSSVSNNPAHCNLIRRFTYNDQSIDNTQLTEILDTQ